MDRKVIKKAVKDTVEDVKQSFKGKVASKRQGSKGLQEEEKLVKLIGKGGTIALLAIGVFSFVWTILNGLGLVPKVSVETAEYILLGVVGIPLAILWDWFWNKVHRKVVIEKAKGAKEPKVAFSKGDE